MKKFRELRESCHRAEEKNTNTMEGDSGGELVNCLNCGGRDTENDSIYWNDRDKIMRRKEDNLLEIRQKITARLSSFHVINNLVTTSLLTVGVLLVMLAGTAPSVVSAVDLNPHGGFYQREGGNDFFPSSAHHQSIFGNSAGGLGGGTDFGDDMGMGDMIMTCSRPVKSSRAAKYLAIKQLDIPCDMGDKKSAWCNLPGDKYPWHAVRRFVFENQGLMRRMYGEVRQLSLLRMEFEDDMDDEVEDERQGPPRAPPLPEDHRRNSILTEVLDESLPRVLSETPPEDQLLLRDHSHLARDTSTPRTLPSSSPPVILTSATTSATTTPIVSSSSMEDVMNATEVMMGVTVDSLSGNGGVGDLNGTTITTVVIGGGEADTASPPSMTTNVGRNGLTEDFIVTEEATLATAGETETDKEDESEATITTTEEMLAGVSEQMVTMGDPAGEQLEVGGAPGVIDPAEQLNDGLDTTGGVGSDESHDFLNLDKNHILYFDDVGKNRRPQGSGNVAAGSSGDFVPPPQGQYPQQQGKLKAVNACPVKEEVVAPYWANNTRGEILALLNLYPFEQYIHWERCNHENKQMFCRQGCRCEQQYRLHRLLAFDPTNECRGIFSDWFRFPSCCVCRCYLNEYELMMLNAAGQDPPPSTAKSRTSDRIRSPRKLLLDQLVDGPDVQGVDDMHFFYKQGYYHEHNHGAQPRRKRSLFPPQEKKS